MAEDLVAEEELRADAWCGEAARGPLDPGSLGWGMRPDVPPVRQPLAPTPVDLAHWRDPRVGWGLVLPDRADVPAADKARGTDAPAPIRELLARRPGSPVLRYRPDTGGRLRRYAEDGKGPDLRFSGNRGLGPNAIPRYLLIVASPDDIPWSAQCRMQVDAFVGRLDLEAGGLERYVDALLGDWPAAAPSRRTPVIWAVDHGHPDITWLMRRSIADRLKTEFAGDPDREFDVGADFYMSDAQATHATLGQALHARNPAFVLTSSHGATAPLDDVAAMRRQLGLPVDANHSVLSLPALRDAWAAHGTIWYAHACCSAGSDGASRFEGLVDAASSLARTLRAVSECGSMSAPLPRALLGGATPARAFIGHVEPTFNWTLRDPVTGQVTTHHIVDALYRELHLATRPPIGLAMSAYYEAVAGLLQDYSDALDAVNAHAPQAQERARTAKLLALDRLGMVVLGDPTVRLPAPSSSY
jgi:hypothetical protein